MKTRIDKTLLLTGALCAALVSGCGEDSPASGASASSTTKKETAKASESAPKPAETAKPAADAATKPSAAAPTGKPAAAPTAPAAPATAANDAAAAAGDAATQAALDKIPTQDELDAAAAKAISSANEDAEFEKLAKEIEAGGGK